MKIHSSCEIEDFVETHLCKLCVILRSRALRVVCPHRLHIYIITLQAPKSARRALFFFLLGCAKKLVGGIHGSSCVRHDAISGSRRFRACLRCCCCLGHLPVDCEARFGLVCCQLRNWNTLRWPTDNGLQGLLLFVVVSHSLL